MKNKKLTLILVVLLICLVGCGYETKIESLHETQIAEYHQELPPPVPQPTPIPTPVLRSHLLPPDDKFVMISKSIPTALDAFAECFKEFVEANGGQIDVTYLEWWLQKNGRSVEEANLVHEGDVFFCYSMPGWWSE